MFKYEILASLAPEDRDAENVLARADERAFAEALLTFYRAMGYINAVINTNVEIRR